MRRYHGSSLRRGRYSESGQIYLITTVCAGRKHVFADRQAAEILMSELLARAQEGYCENQCFVVMPDHFHRILQLADGGYLSSIVARTKGRAAKRINQLRGGRGPLWQPGFHDHAVRRNEDLLQLARYTIFNPVRAGLVACPGEYPYWWSRWHSQ